MPDVVLAKFEVRESELERYRYAPPLAILYLASALEKAGFSVKLFHLEGTRSNIENLASLIARDAPILVGLSTLTGPGLLPTVEASLAIRRRSPVPIVWGGYHPTIVPEQTLQNAFVDVVVMREGEETIVDLARTIRDCGLDAQKLAAIGGIGFKDGGRTVLTPLRPFIKDLDNLDLAWHHLNREDYFYTGKAFRDPGPVKMKVGTAFTSRGCPGRCTYCWNERMNQRTFRAQSAERSVREVLELKERYGVQAIIFEDDNFFADRKRGLEIVRRIGIPWSATLRAVDIARGGPELVKELKAARCQELRIGAETGSPRMLKRLQKDVTVDQMRDAIRLCEENGITTAIMFMVGFPDETWEDIRLTLDLMDELSAMGRHVYVTQLGSYTPYPGTPLFDRAVECGFRPPNSTLAWGRFVQTGFRKYRPPYVDKRARSLTYYRQLMTREDLGSVQFSLPARLLQKLARFRWRHRFFRVPVDHSLPVALRDVMERIGLYSITRRLYRS